ncbi:phosphotyrosine protein phosphatase, partial [Rhizobium ruizarguesonis]
DIEVSSAGTNNDAENPLSTELIELADIVFVMEKAHRTKVQGKYRSALNDKRLICLHIPDDYDIRPACEDLFGRRAAKLVL